MVRVCCWICRRWVWSLFVGSVQVGMTHPTFGNLPSIEMIFRPLLAMVGHLYPKLMISMDRTSMLDYNDDTLQKSQICKSLVLFVGINHMCAVSAYIPNDRKQSIYLCFSTIENHLSKWSPFHGDHHSSMYRLLVGVRWEYSGLCLFNVGRPVLNDNHGDSSSCRCFPVRTDRTLAGHVRYAIDLFV